MPARHLLELEEQALRLDNESLVVADSALALPVVSEEVGVKTLRSFKDRSLLLQVTLKHLPELLVELELLYDVL